MRGSVIENNGEKTGVISVVFVTTDKENARKKINDLLALNQGQADYYMIYSVPLDVDLAQLDHFPSIAIMKSDLN